MRNKGKDQGGHEKTIVTKAVWFWDRSGQADE